MPESIHPDTSIGEVHLTISNMDRSLDFYQKILGFKLQRQDGDTATLGASNSDDTAPKLLVLTERPDAQRTRGTTGLYHYAVLVPSRLDLAHSLQRIMQTRTPVQGFADHLVSEAIYLPDPDGNGIEIYRDRPREEWKFNGDHPRMGTDPLDVDGVLAELSEQDQVWTGLHPYTVMGHMHLHVADITAAEKFYHGVLGFDQMMRIESSASFLSAGGYHHHLGVNTWAGVGAAAAPPNSIGLRHFVIRLPDTTELKRVADRVRQADLKLEETETGLLVRDPSENSVVLTAEHQL